MRELLNAIILESLQEVRADKLLRRALEKEKPEGKFHLAAIGKAAASMARAAHEHFGDRILSGLVITPYGDIDAIADYEILQSSHPYPDENSVFAGIALQRLVRSLQRRDQLLLLISGGASSLAEVPRGSLSIGDINKITKSMQLAGADIIELNTVRKHLSQIKGGQLAQTAAPGKVYSYLLSDVIGDRLDTIGSGPAAADMTTSAAAFDILKKYNIEVSNAVKKELQVETPSKLSNAVSRIIGNNEFFCQIAAEKIMHKGYIPWLLTTDMQGEAQHYAHMIPDIVHSARSPKSKINLPCIAICGGETTVKVQGGGKGGRNQELALAAAIEIKNLHKVTVACVASDGKDGNSLNAGAIIDTRSYDRMLSAGINPENSLHNNDSATALERIDEVIHSGETQSNVNDLLLILVEKDLE